MTLLPNNIPAELRALPNWVTWNPDKAPRIPGSHRFRASVTNPNTWRSFDQAIADIPTWYHGIGFVFTNTPYAGIDLDKCIQGNHLLLWACNILNSLNSYAEVSPSGAGIHIIVRADLPSGRHRGSVELYSSGRYFTMTGHVWRSHNTIHSRQTELRAIYDQLAPKPAPAPNPQRGHGGDSHTVLQKALSARNGVKFGKLYAGNTDRYKSPSEADLALCSMLAYWSNGNQAIMDALFRNSALYRPKWDVIHNAAGQTYGQMTITRALTGI